MPNKVYGVIFFIALSYTVFAQNEEGGKFDSIVVRIHPAYDSVTNMHRFLFGENYRKEWAASTKVPVIKISEISGGLTPTERGGGHQTRSIRLKDKNGKEWVLRSVEKYPDANIPEGLKKTFARDWLRDNMSAQHPYSALVVPVIAEAVKVPHTTPVIGWVAPDKSLGIYLDEFAKTVCLLEEREPAGDSDNTPKMLEKLREDNDNKLDSATFFRARLLDLLIADWDRHGDQWRWADMQKGDGKNYLAIPRDRDLTFYVNEGLIPKTAAKTQFLFFLQGFTGEIKDPNSFFYVGGKFDQQFLNQFSYQQWMQMTREFVSAIPDTVLEIALRKLPESSYSIRHDYLLKQFKARRDALIPAMATYYHFLSKIVDIQTSDKDELVEITDGSDQGLTVKISKLSKERKTEQVLFSRTFNPDITKEIRLFISKGNDSIAINNTSAIKMRLVGGEGNKIYQVIKTSRKINVYDTTTAKFEGQINMLREHLSNDTLITSIVPTNLYSFTKPSFAYGYNFHDGLLLGAGIVIKNEGFRKLPYGSIQQLKILTALATKTFRISYSGEWLKVFRNTDFTLNGIAYIPGNVINFFGRGNETALSKQENYKIFYRVRFDSYAAAPALRFNFGKGKTLSTGASFHYYHFNGNYNQGRLINNPSLINSYDSTTINKAKIHAGLVLKFENDHRDDKVLTNTGFYLNLKLQAYNGLNSYSRSFFQAFPEVSFYRQLDAKSRFVIANRTGAGLTIGSAAFYQSAFLGGHENLLGYLRYRFAGEHMLYNNFEVRVRLKKVESYIVPGTLGVLGFYDVGRVWQKDESSVKWHMGSGFALYYSPIQKLVLKFTLGRSQEGWYPYVNLGHRF